MNDACCVVVLPKAVVDECCRFPARTRETADTEAESARPACHRGADGACEDPRKWHRVATEWKRARCRPDKAARHGIVPTRHGNARQIARLTGNVRRSRWLVVAAAGNGQAQGSGSTRITWRGGGDDAGTTASTWQRYAIAYRPVASSWDRDVNRWDVAAAPWNHDSIPTAPSRTCSDTRVPQRTENQLA
jgi:hypothetical protein